jgi:cellulose synthase operon protein C
MRSYGYTPRRLDRLARVAAFVIPPLFVVTVWVGHRNWDHWRGVHAIFSEAGVMAGYRRMAARLSYGPADRYRPFSAPCDRQDCGVQLQHSDLARLERADDVRGLAAAYALAGDPGRGVKILESMPSSADVESDRAALLSADPARIADALAAVDRALRLDARHAPALWNRAILLDSIGLPLAAARGFRAVEALKEEGWSVEAAQRAERLDSLWRERVKAYRHADAEAERIKSGSLPSADTIATHPDRARLAFFVAVRDQPKGPPPSTLRGIADSLDRTSGTTSLAGLVDQQEVLRQIRDLLKSDAVADVQTYQRLAEGTHDPWLIIRAHQRMGVALAAVSDPKGAIAAYQRALERCDQLWFPYVCLQTKVWLAYVHAGQRQLQDARRVALEAKNGAIKDAVPQWEADANALLATIEDLRERSSFARAYAEEAAAQSENCTAANNGREQLAKIALAEGDTEAARRQLSSVVACPDRPRFGPLGLEALASLAGDSSTGWQEGFRWLTEEIARRRPTIAPASEDDALLRLFEARAMLARDRHGARQQLETLVKANATDDDRFQMIRLQASSALVVDAAEHRELDQALAGLEEMRGLEQGRRCVLGAAQDGGRWGYVVRSATGALAGAYVAKSTTGRSQPRPAVPAALIHALDGCDEVGVIATAPVLGQSRLLPDEVAWGYLNTSDPPRTFVDPVERLVIWDVEPPATLGLQRLLAAPDTTPLPGRPQTVHHLRGPQATPRAALERLGAADLIEWHVHGLFDPEISDAAILALSPGDDGNAFLTGRDILGLRLTRRPGVILGACSAGLSARYGAYQWSLPLAFLQAGARWVIASPTAIEDAEAPRFFAAVWRAIALGASPAVALRDQRISGAWAHSYQQWTRNVVLFH